MIDNIEVGEKRVTMGFYEIKYVKLFKIVNQKESFFFSIKN